MSAAGPPFFPPLAAVASGDATSSGPSPVGGSAFGHASAHPAGATPTYIVTKREPRDDDDEDENGDGEGSPLSSIGTTAPSDSGRLDRKKQKRNKPTLSCLECVERKTKCDRGRPHCLACIKRQTDCQYARVANILEATTRTAVNGRRMTRPPKKRSSISINNSAADSSTPYVAGRKLINSTIVSSGSVALSTGLLSNVPFSLPSGSKVFGIGSGYPFANYWTCAGGLPEVINVLPGKVQSDMLVAQYFECVDPVYPCVHRQTFYAIYEQFWSLPLAEQNSADASFVALLFVMLALGTQFISTTHAAERMQMAEFYASAGNQALRMFSYMSTASIQSIQAMVLLCYFLINDNHASDGWAFAGLLMRQAYAMGLHRDPNIVTPHANAFEKQQRRKLWQAVLLQDTFFVVLLSLPPNATHTDVHVDDFDDDESSIANSDPTDTAYIRGSWTLANLVQETICSPRSLDLPICSTQRQKSKLVAEFRAVYRSFPDVFRSWNQDTIAQLAINNKRVVRQTLFLTSNYYHNLMLVHASESTEVPMNVKATLEAAHEAINAFFTFFVLLPNESRVWWVLNHRAFLEALCIGGILKDVRRSEGDGSGNVNGNGDGEDVEQLMSKDPLFGRARADITRMMEIMEIMGAGEQGSEVARTRVTVLKELL